ncbi:putative ferric reductase [Natronospira proteinivora]|uniref:Ferric reductase n=1 Tax=Natronospira proteinivora TaxID=1807133 RepID=A0ABT1G7F2_9GAMM|nr:ferredoxin reductase family protein [Natronospira proteinivora]MCP1726288.1 putative ferric reductase [Natronospira proteinivora]
MRNPGDGLILALLLIPTLLAAIFGWPGSATAGQWLGYMGRLAGVAGLAAMFIAAIVSVRLPGVDRYFGGLTRLWKQHHYLGLAALLLLLIHPVLMALSRVPFGLPAMQEVLWPASGDWVMWAGWVALIAMMVFLAPSFQFFGRPDYQRWKGIHFLAGLALLLGLLHTLPLTRSMPPAVSNSVWGILGGAALLIFLWRAGPARRIMRKPYEVTRVRQLADRIVEIHLNPIKGKRLQFEPGQFIYFTPRDESLSAGRNEEHPYTLSSAPQDEGLKIAVKDLGDASHALQSLRAQTEASVDGPYGLFFPPHLRHRKQLWIGGGIGITPFVSAAEFLRSGGNEATERWGDSVLINCANDPSRAYYADSLKEAADSARALTLIPHYFAEQGPLNKDFVLAHCPDAGERQWFVCGPPALVRISRDIARELGVPASAFHSEEFDFL